ncbi:pectinesterase family protein [Neptunicella sp. SCSIO 80796]|uniref:pectinesterase family protein n=1 Tax=Neptunicella plasticusilytica TaxID=3117012 RepID=UPI003A4DAC17
MKNYKLSIFVVLCALTSKWASADIQYQISVAQDGSGDYSSIQQAINHTKAFPDRRITIHIGKGIYNEKVTVYAWNTRLSLIGAGVQQTLVRFGDHFNKVNLGRNSTFHTATMQVDANDFRAEGLTIQNTAGPVGQAVALAVNADRAQFNNIALLGSQDTLYVAGEGYRQYFSHCYIEGTTDFIFGAATAVFDDCEIHSKANSYITAASTPKNQPFGLVFFNSRLTADSETDKVYLGRPWRPYAKTLFINTQMGQHIVPEGWHNWSKPEAEKTSYYAEYNSTGLGAAPSKRVNWSHQLTDQQADRLSLESILSAENETSWWQEKPAHQ